MLNKIKKLIGKMTIPNGVITIYGDKYVKCHLCGDNYKYHYQKLKQSKYFGIWGLSSQWISTNTKYHLR